MYISKKLFLISTIFISTIYFIFAGSSDMEPVTSGKSLALGGYYFAGTDDITSAFNNPARIMDFTKNGFAFNITGRSGRQKCRQSENDLHRSFISTDYSGAAGLYWIPSSSLGFALVYNRAADYSLDWPWAISFDQSGTERLYGFHVTAQKRIDVISPIAGFRFGPLGIGVSANLYRVNNEFGFPVGNYDWETNQADPVYLMEMNMQGNAIGWSIGFNYAFNSNFKVGGSLRSGFSQKLDGDAKNDMFFELDSLAETTGIESDFEMPLTGGMGILYKINKNLSINLDFITQLWGNTITSYEFNYNDTAWVNRMPKASKDSLTGYYWTDMPVDFKNNFEIAIGLEYKANNDMHYRFGYRYSKTPNSEQTYSLLYPDVNQHWFSTGIGFEYENYLIDMSCAYSNGIENDIKENNDSYFYGKYDNWSLLPSINIEYKF
ncbi:MAG: outer membrane protein transport protein [Candidatus Marinimicrobia bacterium]|nr:outer membrane protein transport protein [Candidatus Neomarinimicrobiota bacterium]